MTRLAVEGVDYFVADEREVHRDGWTYTADTLKTFDPDDELTLILGADSARGLPTWERSEEVLARVRLAVAPRPGTAPDEVRAAVSGTPVEWLDMVPLDVSGTLIRERVAAGRSIRFLVRDSVWRYIVAENLYTDEVGVPVA